MVFVQRVLCKRTASFALQYLEVRFLWRQKTNICHHRTADISPLSKQKHDWATDHRVLLTLRGLGAYIFLDQGICRLSVKAESIFERFHIGALLEEGFLQPVSTRMEILLQMKRRSSNF